MRRPFPPGTISSGFGRRIVPGTTWWHHHSGEDYAVPAGSTVYAIAAGVVVAVHWHEQLGNVIEIRHDEDRVSKYMHLLDAGDVEPGDLVDEGQRIGRVGNTGRASRGAHLHLEAWQAGVCINPAIWWALAC